MSYATRAAALALLIALCFGLTTAAAAYAVRRPELRTLDTETASRLHADYSRDPIGIKLRRLDAKIIADTARDEIALLTTSTPQRVQIVHEPTATPFATQTPPPSRTPASSPTANASPTPGRTGTPPPPTASPAPVTPAPETVVPPSTSTPAPKPTDTPVVKPTSTRAIDTPAPFITPTFTPTRTPSATPTRTSTPVPADTVIPVPTNTPTPTATPSYTPTFTATPTSTPTSTPSFTPTPTPSPTDTPVPTPTPSDTPTPTPTPTYTPTSTPTITPTPITVQLDAAADTYLELDNAASVNGGSNDLIVDGDSDKVNRALVLFDVSGISSGATVQDAKLTLCYSGNPTGGSQGHVHSLHRVTSGWLELVVTWGLLPTFSSTITDSIIVPSSQQCMTFNVASDVQAWVDGTSNYGWLLKDADESQPGSSDAKYRSREDGSPVDHPRLDITYRP